MAEYPILRERLSAVYRLVRRGSVAADVGTDHAYLPIALCLDGVSPRVIASDVKDGPVQRAKEDVARYGLSDAITVVKTDGLLGLDIYSPDDILIAGMGGELIVRILQDAPWICKHGIRLVLQPMTHQETVRRYLLASGFSIVCEEIAEDDGGRIYQIIAAEYDGIVRETEDTPEGRVDLTLGGVGVCRNATLYLKHLRRNAEIYRRRIDGKAAAEKQSGEMNDALRRDREIYDEIVRRIAEAERMASDEG